MRDRADTVERWTVVFVNEADIVVGYAEVRACDEMDAKRKAEPRLREIKEDFDYPQLRLGRAYLTQRA